jgi:Ig-like domain CHU_C associated/Domain of unknown function (DUF4214)
MQSKERSFVKPIRLIPAVVFFLASAVSATVFQPASDRQLVDRSDAVVVATVRDAATRVLPDGHIVTDYRFDVEQTLKGTAAATIIVSEIGGVSGQRFTFISDSAAYSPGERVLVFLKKRNDGTYFTTSMAMGKFSFTRNAAGEAVVTRDVSELRNDPARAAEGFARFVREASQGHAASERYTTTLTPIGMSLHVTPLASAPASAYCLTAGGFPVRWQGGDVGVSVTFYVTGGLTGVPNTSASIANGLAAWTNDPNAFIVLNASTAQPPMPTATPNGFDRQNVIYLGQTSTDGVCDGGQACTIGTGNDPGTGTHSYMGETFVSITDADIVVSSTVGASQFEALITHEFGHAIGFRHSNQGTPFDSNAMMATPVSAALGSSLQQWDRDANDTVYGKGPACVSPTSASISGGGSVALGQTATLFASVVGGNGTFTYNWFLGSPTDTSHPVGSNSATFTTPAITGTTNYWVHVSNTCGSVQATATVFPQDTTCTSPNINGQPISQTINANSTATLIVNASGSQPLTYQWYQATSNTDTRTMVGSNSPFFTTPALTQATSYWVSVKNSCGTAISNVATISITGVCTKPVFSIQPSTTTLVSGSQTYLIAFATGATSYQWYKGNAGDTSTPVAGAGPSNERWVNQVYVDLLGRPAEAASVATFAGLITGGTPRATVALSVLTSTEYRQRLVTSFYATFLHRTPSAAELAFWLPAFAANLSDEQIEAQIVASPEYLSLAGGTNAAWINRMFSDVLGRTPSALEASNFSALLSTFSRTTVGLVILNSSETANRHVQQYFTRFLRRSATGAEASSFAAALVGGSTDEQVIAQILALDEYFNFGTVLLTDVISATTRYWVRATNTCGSTDSDTAALNIPQCTLPVIVTQPSNVTVNVGAPVSVSVLASDAASYQWYRAASGDPSNAIAGATGPVLATTLFTVGPTQFWVKVTNTCGSTNSATVTITTLCAPRALTMTVPPTAPSASTYTASWDGDSQLDTRYEVQEATKTDFSDAQTFAVSGTPSRSFTHTVTADTRYYYRIHAAPACGGDFGTFSAAGSIVVTAPLVATQSNYNFAQSPCTGANCTTRQPLFIPGFPVTSGKTALAVGDTFSVSSDKLFVTVSPSSGALPPEGVTVIVTIDTSQLDVGSTQASVTVNRIPAAGKVGALGDPPATTTVPISVSVVAPVTQKPKDPNAPFNALIIPAIAHADGIGTRFVSDVRLTNTSAQSITYQLTYTPANTDGTQNGKQTSITVAAGDTKALNDIVKDWYGSGVSGEADNIGSLEIRPLNFAGKDPVSISVASVAASRTYSVTAAGTFGQYIPALPLANFLAKSVVSKISLQQVSQTSAAGGFRTNLGFVEGSGQPVDFVATLFDDGGQKLAERAYSLKPYESQQIRLDTSSMPPASRCRTCRMAVSK